MPLDTDLVKFLERLASRGVPALGTVSPQESRDWFANNRLFEQEIPTVAKIEDRWIESPDRSLPIRIYTPDGTGPAPILMYLHGGGWILGMMEVYDVICRRLANAVGAIVVSVDYRLAPEYKFPAAAQDCYEAYTWVRSNAGLISGDPTRMAVAGDSAGGNLSAVLAQMIRDRGEDMPSLQVLIYPLTEHSFERPSHIENAEAPGDTTEALRWGSKLYLASEADRLHPYASPLQATDFSGLPPALIITAEFDPLRDEGEEYGEKLREAGVPVVVTRYDGVIHGFFGWDDFVAKSREAFDQVVTALKSNLSLE